VGFLIMTYTLEKRR